MPKVKIVSREWESEYGDMQESVTVFINDVEIGSGCYGGEPEDNMRIRHYSWVEPLIQKIALYLGAEVEFINKDTEED